MSFKQLPAEIREQIWLHTLTPRLIFIHPHERLFIQDNTCEVQFTTSIRFNHTAYDTRSTPATVFKGYAESMALSSEEYMTPKNEQWKRRDKDDYMKATRSLHYKSSAPPPALVTCRQSRAIALNEGYVLAFQGKLVDYPWDEEYMREINDALCQDKLITWIRQNDGEADFWRHNHMFGRGIWVNWQRDMIMFDVEQRPGIWRRGMRRNPLHLLAEYSPQELVQIQRLALGGTLENILGVIKADRSWADLHKGLRDFTIEHELPMLQEIWIDDEFEAEGNMGDYYFEKDDEPLYMSNRFPEPEFALYAVQSFLKDKNKSGISSAGYTPLIRIVRGQDWHNQLAEAGFN